MNGWYNPGENLGRKCANKMFSLLRADTKIEDHGTRISNYDENV